MYFTTRASLRISQWHRATQETRHIQIYKILKFRVQKYGRSETKSLQDVDLQGKPLPQIEIAPNNFRHLCFGTNLKWQKLFFLSWRVWRGPRTVTVGLNQQRGWRPGNMQIKRKIWKRTGLASKQKNANMHVRARWVEIAGLRWHYSSLRRGWAWIEFAPSAIEW